MRETSVSLMLILPMAMGCDPDRDERSRPYAALEQTGRGLS